MKLEIEITVENDDDGMPVYGFNVTVNDSLVGASDCCYKQESSALSGAMFWVGVWQAGRYR